MNLGPEEEWRLESCCGIQTRDRSRGLFWTDSARGTCGNARAEPYKDACGPQHITQVAWEFRRLPAHLLVSWAGSELPSPFSKVPHLGCASGNQAVQLLGRGENETRASLVFSNSVWHPPLTYIFASRIEGRCLEIRAL